MRRSPPVRSSGRICAPYLVGFLVGFLVTERFLEIPSRTAQHRSTSSGPLSDLSRLRRRRSDPAQFALTPPAAVRPQGRLAADLWGGPDQKKQRRNVLVESVVVTGAVTDACRNRRDRPCNDLYRVLPRKKGGADPARSRTGVTDGPFPICSDGSGALFFFSGERRQVPSPLRRSGDLCYLRV